MKEQAKEYLQKEYKRLMISLERATKRPGVTQTELDDLQYKINIIEYLQGRCEL